MTSSMKPSPVSRPAKTSVASARSRVMLFTPDRGTQYFTEVNELRQHLKPPLSSPVTAPFWIDLDSSDADERGRLLASIPQAAQVSEEVRKAVVWPSETDVVELQPIDAGYVLGTLSCSAGESVTPSRQRDDEERHASRGGGLQSSGSTAVLSAEMMDAANGVLWCTFLATAEFIVTFHGGPFVGLAELVRSVELRFAPRPHAAADDAAFTTSAVLATLVAFTCEALLPDPTALLSEVDSIDEMVLLIAPGARDQPDLLRRVAILRRSICTYRAGLYQKEKLVQELVTPSMRGSFVAMDAAWITGLYRETLAKLTQVADRLDDARDMLNQANLNFVTGVSMRMSQSSANMDFKMQVLGQVATICLPLNLIASIFGMNVTVPWSADTHPSTTAFWCIVGVMVFWCLLCSVPTIRDTLRGNTAKAIVPLDT